MSDKVVFYTTAKSDNNQSRSASPDKGTPSNPLLVKKFNTTISSFDLESNYVNQSRPGSANTTRPMSATSRPMSAKNGSLKSDD